jgi:uncharacterized protein
VEEDILSYQDHRPFSLPREPWVMEQSWNDLLFAHWPIDPALIISKMPKELALDIWDKQAFIGVVPFKMRGVKFRGMPHVPSATDFLELNVRTYVIYKGRPGIYFFSLDASSALAVIGARIGAGLKYFYAKMHVEEKEGTFLYKSERFFSNDVSLKISYRPLSDEVYKSEKGSLEEWFTERYCLFSQPLPGLLLEVDIHHLQWPLQKAEAEIEKNTMTLPLGFNLGEAPAFLHFARHQKVVVWAPSLRKFYKAEKQF